MQEERLLIIDIVGDMLKAPLLEALTASSHLTPPLAEQLGMWPKLKLRIEGPEKVTRGGVNGSLYPKIDPTPFSSNSAKTAQL
jgi:hypothetical protein